jgi:uncharacterized protein YjiS (DUF1127 family)
MTDDILRHPVPRATSTLRLIARCIRCYVQARSEQRELSAFGHHALRDIGLTEYDVAMETRQAVWQRCWRRCVLETG